MELIAIVASIKLVVPSKHILINAAIATIESVFSPALFYPVAVIRWTYAYNAKPVSSLYEHYKHTIGS